MKKFTEIISNKEILNEGIFSAFTDKLFLSISKQMGSAKKIDELIDTYIKNVISIIDSNKELKANASIDETERREKINDLESKKNLAKKKLDITVKKIIESSKSKDIIQNYYDTKIIESEEKLLDYKSKNGYLSEEEKKELPAKKTLFEEEKKKKMDEVRDIIKKQKASKNEENATIKVEKGKEYIYTSVKDGKTKSKVIIVSDKPNNDGEVKVQSVKTKKEWMTLPKQLSLSKK